MPAHAPADPQIAVDVDSQAVRSAAFFGGNQRPTVCQLRPIVRDVVNPDDSQSDARLDDVQLRFVGRKREPVRTIDVTDHDAQCFRRRIPAIDVGRQFHWRLVAFPVKAEMPNGGS